MKLGFGSSPRGRKVYMSRKYPESLWYFWNHDVSKPEPILSESLTGYLKAVHLSEKEYKGEPVDKINFTLDCGDEKYILEVGVGTIHAGNLISGFAEWDLTKAATIEPSASSKEGSQALWVNFYDGVNRVQYDRVPDDRLMDALDDLMFRVNGTRTPLAPPDDQQEPAPARQPEPVAAKVPESAYKKHWVALREDRRVPNAKGVLVKWVLDSYGVGSPFDIDESCQQSALAAAAKMMSALADRDQPEYDDIPF